jgi:diguanylate cyclase (GGDEF)-like protein/PAS domain S-box-containing protein
MRPQGSENLPEELRADAEYSSAGQPEGGATEDAQVRPFLERRRQRSMENSWHEALDSVHRMLARYEEANQLLAEAEESYRSLFENALIGLFRLGSGGEPLIVNPSMAAICGCESPAQLLAEVSNLGEQIFGGPDQWREFVQQAETSGYQSGLEAEAGFRDGVRKWVELNIRAVVDAGGAVFYEGTMEDITDRKMDEERIRLLAYYDLVTGLPNRPLFEERLEEALTVARWKSRRVALLVLELGRFKMINDSLGRAYGDRLLKEVAERIRNSVGEAATVARVSGAEFAVILEDVNAVQDVERVAEKVVVAVGGDFSYIENSINVTCTVGISMFPLDGWDAHTLVERANVALYSAKEQGAKQFQFFTEEMNNRIRVRLNLENGLRMALERDELFLVYQAQVDLRTGGVSGLEALLRWQHPEMGLVPPSDFIGVAESSGLILPIGEWVLRTACSQARKWQDAGLRAVPVAVNVSAIQFRQPGFCAIIRRVLKETGLDPKYLELELTEGLLLTNVEVMFVHIQELRDLGVKLTIDDFGTGYSSLGYLRQFKVNRLKIDRSFVREVSVNADDAAITTAIINMARALNLDVLAEGVENIEQLDFLRAQNCFEIQGYYFTRPVAVDLIAGQLQSTFLH